METGEEKTRRGQVRGGEKDMEIEEGGEVREGRRGVMKGTDGNRLDGKGGKWRKTYCKSKEKLDGVEKEDGSSLGRQGKRGGGGGRGMRG